MEGVTPKDPSYHEAKITNQNGSSKILRVPVVQELARKNVRVLPKIFLHQENTITTNTIPHTVLTDDIPSVSLSRLRATTTGYKERVSLCRGASQWGIVLVTDHGIPMGLLGMVKEVVRGFFELSIEEKRKCVGTYRSTDNMGYGRNYVKSEDQVFEWVDRLTMMSAPKGSTSGLHVWPLNPPNFRDIMEQYTEEARNVCDQLLESLAEALSLDKHTFLKYFDPESSEVKLRINYYPPCPNPDSTLGINPHSDPSALSLLIQMNNSGGLQAMHKDENIWRTVPWPTDALLVLVGDILEIMSNGRLNSALHRVITQPHAERLSVALFYCPPPTAEIEPVKKDGSGKDEYKKVVAGEYVEHYYKVSPAFGKETTLRFARV